MTVFSKTVSIVALLAAATCAAPPAGLRQHIAARQAEAKLHLAKPPTADVFLHGKVIAGVQAWPPVWPLPQRHSNGSTVQPIAVMSLKVTLVGGARQVSATLGPAISRFEQRTAGEHTPVAAPVGIIDQLDINVVDPNALLQLGVDESYALEVNSRVIIKAQTVYGALHALETLSQLTRFDFDNQLHVIRGAPWSISDAPRFPHRGILIDTSRHFIPVKQLRAAVDSLTFAKFNTMHWHIVDAQSFAYDSTTFPRLGKYSAFSPQERYTRSDVVGIVKYAAARGVRVLVELDTPGHTASMCKAYPEICPQPFCTDQNVDTWALDVTKEEAFIVVEGLWREFQTIFPDRYVHIGGDEVNTHCWSTHPRIVKWFEAHNMTLNQGYEYWIKRITTFLQSDLQKNVVGWNEIWDHFRTQLNRKTIINQWIGDAPELVKDVTSNGYRLIWSNMNVWYLDHLYTDWYTMYTAEPCEGLSADECRLVLGGEGSMWGETVDTSDQLQTIWPRAAAIAERLWSNNTITGVSSYAATAYDRLRQFRCLLNRRGVPAAPVNNGEARNAPPFPGSCFDQ